MPGLNVLRTLERNWEWHNTNISKQHMTWETDPKLPESWYRLTELRHTSEYQHLPTWKGFDENFQDKPLNLKMQGCRFPMPIKKRPFPLKPEVSLSQHDECQTRDATPLPAHQAPTADHGGYSYLRHLQLSPLNGQTAPDPESWNSNCHSPKEEQGMQLDCDLFTSRFLEESRNGFTRQFQTESDTLPAFPRGYEKSDIVDGILDLTLRTSMPVKKEKPQSIDYHDPRSYDTTDDVVPTILDLSCKRSNNGQRDDAPIDMATLQHIPYREASENDIDHTYPLQIKTEFSDEGQSPLDFRSDRSSESGVSLSTNEDSGDIYYKQQLYDELMDPNAMHDDNSLGPIDSQNTPIDDNIHCQTSPRQRQGKPEVNGKSDRKPDDKGKTECTLLWEFLDGLLSSGLYDSLVRWEDMDTLTFRIVNPNGLAQLWGVQKCKANMTYEKMSRALRYYYKMNIISKVPGRRLTYRYTTPPQHIVKGIRGAKPGVPHRKRKNAGVLDLSAQGKASVKRKTQAQHKKDNGTNTPDIPSGQNVKNAEATNS